MRAAVRRRADSVYAAAITPSHPTPVVRTPVDTSFSLGGVFTLGGPAYCHAPPFETASAFLVQQQVVWVVDRTLHVTTVQGATSDAAGEAPFVSDDATSVGELGPVTLTPAPDGSGLILHWVGRGGEHFVRVPPADSARAALVAAATSRRRVGL